MTVVQMVTTGLGIAVGVTGLITFGASLRTARSGNQRDLRDRLRKQLREMNLGCLVHLKRGGWQAVNRMPQFSCQGLDQVHQDGLLSPGRSHIERLKRILRDIRDSQEAMVPTMEKSIFSQPTDAEKARIPRRIRGP